MWSACAKQSPRLGVYVAHAQWLRGHPAHPTPSLCGHGPAVGAEGLRPRPLPRRGRFPALTGRGRSGRHQRAFEERRRRGGAASGPGGAALMCGRGVPLPAGHSGCSCCALARTGPSSHRLSRRSLGRMTRLSPHCCRGHSLARGSRCQAAGAGSEGRGAAQGTARWSLGSLPCPEARDCCCTAYAGG